MQTEVIKQNRLVIWDNSQSGLEGLKIQIVPTRVLNTIYLQWITVTY